MVQANAWPLRSAAHFPMTPHSHHQKSVVLLEIHMMAFVIRYGNRGLTGLPRCSARFQMQSESMATDSQV